MAGRKVINCGLYNGLKWEFRPLLPTVHAWPLVVWLVAGLAGQAESLALPSSPAITQLGPGGAAAQLGEWNPSLPQTCQLIDMSSLCADMPYNYTTMPNLVGQHEVVEAVASLESFKLLVRSFCSPRLKFFLCSVYQPMCTTIAPTESIVVVPPCRSLCKEVRTKCEPVLQEFTYKWPENINCNDFPEENKPDQMCMPGYMPAESPADIPFDPQSNDLESHLTPLVSSSAIPPRRPNAICGQPENAFVFLNTTKRCALSCDANFITSKEEKFYAEVFHGLVAGLTYLAAIVVGLLFACKGKRTSEQEKPIFMILLCLVGVASGYLVRLVGGRRVGCSHALDGRQAFLVGHGLDIPQWPCVVVFILLFYFTLAANIWWLILTISWFCSAVRNQKTDSIKALLKRLHWVAWILPAILTGVGILGKHVDSDELTTLCYVGQQNSTHLFWFVLVPLLAITGSGSFIVLIGCIQLRRNKSFVIAKMSTLNSTKLNPKAASFANGQDEKLFVICVLFLPSTLIVIGCYFTEWLHREEFQTTPDQIHVALYFVRISMQFVYGLVVAVWFCVTAKRHKHPVSSQQTKPLLKNSHLKPALTPIFISPPSREEGQMKSVGNGYFEDEGPCSDFYHSIGTGPYSPSPSIQTASTQYPVGYSHDRRVVHKMMKQVALHKDEFCKESFHSVMPFSAATVRNGNGTVV